MAIQNEICFRRYLDTGNHVNLWFTSDVFEVGSAGNKVNPTPKHNRKHVQPNFHNRVGSLNPCTRL